MNEIWVFIGVNRPINGDVSHQLCMHYANARNINQCNCGQIIPITSRYLGNMLNKALEFEKENFVEFYSTIICF